MDYDPMNAKCECQQCAGHIEFEETALQPSGETPQRTLGQFIDCPHCGAQTQLYLPRVYIPRFQESNETKPEPSGKNHEWKPRSQIYHQRGRGRMGKPFLKSVEEIIVAIMAILFFGFVVSIKSGLFSALISLFFDDSHTGRRR